MKSTQTDSIEYAVMDESKAGILMINKAVQYDEIEDESNQKIKRKKLFCWATKKKIDIQN